jgi:hypothetical protein
VISGVFFVPLKQFLDYVELFLTLKINSKKRKSILLERAEPEGPTRSGPPTPAPARQARQGPSAKAGNGSLPPPPFLDMCASDALVHVPIKGGSLAPRVP